MALEAWGKSKQRHAPVALKSPLIRSNSSITAVRAAMRRDRFNTFTETTHFYHRRRVSCVENATHRLRWNRSKPWITRVHGARNGTRPDCRGSRFLLRCTTPLSRTATTAASVARCLSENSWTCRAASAGIRSASFATCGPSTTTRLRPFARLAIPINEPMPASQRRRRRRRHCRSTNVRIANAQISSKLKSCLKIRVWRFALVAVGSAILRRLCPKGNLPRDVPMSRKNRKSPKSRESRKNRKLERAAEVLVL